jgi:hypothetical protein
MRHLDLHEIAALLIENPLACRHLAEACSTCGGRLRQIEALMERFQHWSPEVAVLEGLPAESHVAAILAAGDDFTAWSARIDENEEFQTWGVAWVALEQAQERLAEAASSPRARDLALLAAKVTEGLGDSYHPEAVADLKARAYATAAAAERPDADRMRARLQQVAAAVTALEKGSGDEAVAREVWSLLSRVVR